ncbi:MAG: hypothetical protein HY795_12715 [Desulfovibrio sp.]|nr:hypothetical protein [Desulfovibrio sp.]MBI4960124.1 hypothetical protein [Desulfovibrio sp.]
MRWLITPDGTKFFSLGVNNTSGSTNDEKAQKAHAYYWGRFYPNLDAWGQDTQSRLTTWGFNTAGGWSDVSPVMSFPVIPEIDLGRNSKLHWYDIFDPSMQDAADEIARTITAKYKANPRILGYFTDNEVGWWNSPLFLWHLERGWAFSSKRVLWQLLYDHYEGKWDRLLKDFVPAGELDSFEKLKETGAALKLRPGGQGIRVIGKYTYQIAKRYYELAFNAMRKADPKALVVGDRLPLYYNQDAVLAQKGFVDVLSTNYNVDGEDGWVAPYYFEGLRDLSDAPVLISEYFFAADENRSGNVNNGHLMHVKTQEQRAKGAVAAMRNFASFPNVAGVHWFQYTDEPTGGRSDGEDFNMGLVDIHNKPYELLTSAFSELNPRIPAIHAASRWTQKSNGDIQTVILRTAASKDLADGTLTDWPDKASTRLTGFSTPKPYVPFGDVHLAWGPEGLSFFNIAGNYVDLALLDYSGEYPLSETYQIRITLDAGAGPRTFGVHLTPGPHSVWPGRFELRPQIWRYENGAPVERIEDKGLVQALDKPLPHIQVEGLIPAGLMGVTELKPGQDIRLSIEVTNFYRELTMALGPRTVVLGQAVDNAGAAQ